MKTVVASVMVALAVAAVGGCLSPRGGSVVEGEGFKIGAPTFTTDIRQGDRQTVTVSLHREEYFKQDVRLQLTADSGIHVEPTDVLVKASDSPDVQVRISTAKDAALSSYRVVVKATPETGEPTSKEFTVKVVAP